MVAHLSRQSRERLVIAEKAGREKTCVATSRNDAGAMKLAGCRNGHPPLPRGQKLTRSRRSEMVITPLVAAIIVGSFWTGVGATAVISQSDAFDRYDTDTR